MLTSTIACARPRILLGPGEMPAHGRYAAVSEQRSQPQRLSPAGLHRRPWLRRLRRALAEDLFVLHFQPIVALQGGPDVGGSWGPISHYEALLRLADEPDGRLVGPDNFLPAAERYGLIRDIDRMVLARVAAVLADRGSSGAGPGASIAINVSAVSVTDAGMLEEIERQLTLAQADPSRLVIEVTETASISDMERARAFCAGVQALGCAVALDDFGAGFGSLQYLKHLPYRYLKIDGGFIRGLLDSRNDQLVVRALVGVVRGMGAETIAEFVGDEATMRLLRSYGVDHAQGFHVGVPGPLASHALCP